MRDETRDGRVSVGTVLIKCPQTGRAISTGIKADRSSFQCSAVFFARTHCPICATSHEWFSREAWVHELERRPGRVGRTSVNQAPARVAPGEIEGGQVELRTPARRISAALHPTASGVSRTGTASVSSVGLVNDVLGFAAHDLVAFACCFFEPRPVDLDQAAPFGSNNAVGAKLLDHLRDRCSPHAE